MTCHGPWLVAVALAARAAAASSGSDLCAPCHRQIYERYRQTAMAHSLYQPRPENTIEDYRVNNRYYHPASDTHFQMLQRDGKYYQRRYQIGFGGKETNIDEQQIDFVMGSGNHARSYLHRTAAGALVELPLAWYAEKGGYWAMGPGYDRPDPPDSRRKVGYECMFCHNAYPQTPASHGDYRAEPVYSALAEGIDCQRCHGQGDRHIAQAQTPGATTDAIRKSIVNPARLDPARQMEVCMQCHLETTSFPFPQSIRKYNQEPFSYQAGQPLADFMLFFDHGPANRDRFQIVSSVYRLRMSACFLKSGGKLLCTTCHNPHGANVPAQYNEVCASCHSASVNQMAQTGLHTKATDCVGCHMTKRRTADVVHAVITDHYIQRPKRGHDLLAEITEPSGTEIVYRGEVSLYYPAPLDPTPDNELYLDLAQVRMDNNLEAGVGRFTAALAKYQPKQSEFYSELGDAMRRSGHPDDAIPRFEEALKLKPDSPAAWIGLGGAYEALAQYPKALEAFERAIAVSPSDALVWQEMAQVYIQRGQRERAIQALDRSLALDSTVPQTQQLLGTLWMKDDVARAEKFFREAIRLQPGYAQALANLAVLLSETDRTEEAAYTFERALRLRPNYALAHLNYGLMLRKVGRRDEARQHFGQAVNTADAATRAAAQRLLSELGGH
jgi:predicted CXXCH cytochrome family protein